jgi:hypothetical protein
MAIAFYFARDKSFKIKALFVYFFLATILMSIASVYVILKKNNIELYNLLFLINSICLGIYFYAVITTSAKRIFIALFIISAIVYYLINEIFLNTFLIFDSIGYAALRIGIVIMIFMYFHQVLGNVNEYNLLYNFDFWFASSQTLYSFGSFIIFLTYNYFTRQNAVHNSRELSVLFTKVWGIHNVALFLSSIIIITGITWITFRKK